MSRFGRRTFLASSAGIAAGAAVAGALAAGAGAGRVARTRERPVRSAGRRRGAAGHAAGRRRSRSTASSTPSASTPTTARSPGPCRRPGAQRARRRPTASWSAGPTRATAGSCGTAARCRRPARPSSPTAGPPSPPTRAYEWTVQPRGAGRALGAGRRRRRRFTTALRAADWQAQWLRPAGDSQQPDRVTYLRTEVTPPAGTVAPRHGVRLRRAHLPAVRRRGAGRRLAQLLLPRRAVRARRRPDRRRRGRAAQRPRRAAPLVRARPGPPGLGARACSSSCRSGTTTAATWSSGPTATWRERPAEWLPSPQRNADGGDFVEWVDGRAQPAGLVEPGLRRQRAGRRVTVIGPAGTAPFTTTYAQRTTIEETPVLPVRLHTVAGGAVVADFGAVYAARPRVRVRHGAGRAAPSPCGRATCSIPTGRSRRCTARRRPTSRSPTSCGAGHQAFEAFTYFGFRYLQIDNAGPGARAGTRSSPSPGTPPCPTVPAATFSTDNRMLNAVWRLNARSCLYCSQEQFVDTPTREKGQFLWDAANESEAVMRAYGDQNMSWQALRDVARGQARYWPDGRVNAVYPNGDGARYFATFTRALSRVAVALLRSRPATAHRGASLPLGRRGRPTGCGRHARPATGCSTGWATPATAIPSTATTSRWRPTRPATCWRSTPSTAWRSWPTWPATPPARRPSRRGPPSWPRRSTRRCAGPTASTSTASTPTARRAAARRRRPTRWRWPTAWCRRPTWPRSAPTWRSLGIDLGPNHGLELLRALAAAGLPDAMVRTLTDASIPGWAHIVAAGGTFTWEEWKPSDLIGDSMSHGWGSSALVAMQETLLGVTLPGARTPTARSAPPSRRRRPASTAPQGSVPTVAGPVQVSWQRRGRGMAAGPDGAGQRVGARCGCPPAQRVERARGRHRPAGVGPPA